MLVAKQVLKDYESRVIGKDEVLDVIDSVWAVQMKLMYQLVNSAMKSPEVGKEILRHLSESEKLMHDA